MKRLSPWNPLDHLRLLWWMLVTPQRLMAYRRFFGENAENSVGRWLVNTLFWLPFLIPTLSLGVGILPRIKMAHSRVLDLLMCVGLVLAWVLTSRLESGKGWLAIFVFFVVVAVTGIAAFVTAFLMADGIEVDVVGIGALFVVLDIAVGLAYSLSSNSFGTTNLVYAHYGIYLVFPVAFLVKFGLTGIGGGVAIFIVLVLSAGSRIADVIEKSVAKSLKTGRSSWLAWSAFGAILLVYAFLMWFSFLGGWRVFV